MVIAISAGAGEPSPYHSKPDICQLNAHAGWYRLWLSDFEHGGMVMEEIWSGHGMA